MGQYYFPCILKKNWKLAKQPVKMSLYSWDFDNGMKLMEHSYVGNRFVMSVLYLLAHTFKGLPFAWVGDYADKKMTHAHPEGVDIYSMASGLTDGGSGHNLYELYKKAIPDYAKLHNYRYIINRTKKEYVVVPEYKPSMWQIHPLPILCSDGNGRGGGDYNKASKFVGRWAYDVIDVSDDEKEVKGYKCIRPRFKED